ncbi:hypothetical protein ACJX0J_031304 [Zea mays]
MATPNDIIEMTIHICPQTIYSLTNFISNMNINFRNISGVHESLLVPVDMGQLKAVKYSRIIWMDLLRRTTIAQHMIIHLRASIQYNYIVNYLHDRAPIQPPMKLQFFTPLAYVSDEDSMNKDRSSSIAFISLA